MPLVKALLSNGFQQLFEGNSYPTSEQDAGQQWASVYKKYASGAAAGAALVVAASLVAAQSSLASALETAFKGAKSGSPAAPTMAAAFAAFWLTPPVAFATPPASGVVSIAVPVGLIASLSDAFDAGVKSSKSAADQAQALATALDSFTTTVMVGVITAPAPAMVPTPLS